MIVLDTNVVSEAMKPEPHPNVNAWLNAQPAQTLYLTSVTLAEMQFGIGTLSDGRRKQMLKEALNGVINLFEGRILSFDRDAAHQYANVAVNARTAGRGLPVPDGYIAAIAVAHGFSVASRDMAPFAAAQVAVINPWQ
ncbi:type II toxin-antitoxin system VapC family toxin [Cellvibrio sp. pealriver]|uniref:type II toxin-antitoxin system VapC family toxin n=1 Tax=Cellvibrio sp. pealriver TaxID=1622269 RepID=UPI00066FBE0F|nr:type II toxin-antitoxin system VapC family toxin [Cellvibrio sp. pealriver]